MDGAFVGDTVASMLDPMNRIWNDVRYDEYGGPKDAFWTGTTGNNCADYTGTTGYGMSGVAYGGPGSWISAGGNPCSATFPILCVMHDANVAASPPAPPAGSKRIFISNAPFVPGGGIAAAHAACDASKPAGMGTVHALLATTTSPASTFLAPSTTYARPDGVVIGTGADLIAAATGNLPSTGIWQAGNGSYSHAQLWSGAADLTTAGTSAGTCADWTSTASTAGVIGWSYVSSSRWWYLPFPEDCTANAYLRCVEQ
jgi:hypothetical protein